MTLSEFREQLIIANNRSKFNPMSGLAKMYKLLDDLGWHGRLWIWIQIFLTTTGSERQQLFAAFTIYNGMKKML